VELSDKFVGDGHRRHGQAGSRSGYPADPLQSRRGGQESHPTRWRLASYEWLRRPRSGGRVATQINDPALNEADSTTTARALAAGIKKLDHVDLVLSGRQASDTDGGQVHLGVASHLGLPAVSPVQKIDDVSAESLTVERIVEDGYQRLKVKLPALIGVSSEINEPRYPPLKGIMAAGRAQIPVWTAADLGLDSTQARVQLRRLYVETREAQVELIEADSLEEAGTRLADKLREARLV
jgi:electron transfer flavoprotein beta subunit